jgi:hypothetical protein
MTKDSMLPNLVCIFEYPMGIIHCVGKESYLYYRNIKYSNTYWAYSKGLKRWWGTTES